MIASLQVHDEAYHSAASGLLTTSDDGTIRRVNRTFEHLLRHPPDSLTGTTLTALFTPGSALLFEVQLRPRLLLRERLDGVFVSLRDAQGETIPTVVNAVRRPDGDLEFAFIVVREREAFEERLRRAHAAAETARSELADTARALRESEARVRAQFAAIPIPTFVWRAERDGRLRLEHANDAGHAMLDETVTRRGAASLELSQAFDHDAQVRDTMQQALSEQRVLQCDVPPAPRLLGGGRLLELTCGPLPPSHVVLHVRDVTHERSLAARELHRQKLEALGELVAGIAHEFNNALAIIQGHLELLDADLHELHAADHPCFEDVRTVRAAADRAVAIVRQLLAFSGQKPSAPTRLDLNQIVRSARELLGPVMGRRIRWSLDLAADLPPVRGDANVYTQVITNLAINARDAIREAGDEGCITIRTATGAASDGRVEVRVTVTDTGVGMTPAVRERALEPFFTTKPAGHGTGLGLAMVFGVVREAGGHLEIASALGEGTAVSLHLPADLPEP